MNYIDPKLLPVVFELNDINYDEDKISEFSKQVLRYKKAATEEGAYLISGHLAYRMNSEFMLIAPITGSKKQNTFFTVKKVHKTAYKKLSKGDTKLIISTLNGYTLKHPCYIEPLSEQDIQQATQISKEHMDVLLSFADFNRINNQLSNKLLTYLELEDIIRQSLVPSDSQLMTGAPQTSKDESRALIELVSNLFACTSTDYTTPKKLKSCESQIINVREFNNTRLAIIKSVVQRHTVYTPFICGHKHEYYNYLDVGRQVIIVAQRRGYWGYNTQLIGFLSEMNVELPDDDILQEAAMEYDRSVGNKVIDIARLKEISSKIKIKQQATLTKQQKEERAKKAIGDRFAKLKQKDGHIKLNDVDYYKGKIVYEDQELSIDDVDSDSVWVYNMLKGLMSSYKISEITFNVILSNFINILLSSSVEEADDEGYQKASSATIGDVEVEYGVKIINRSDGSTQTLHYINGSRINASELKACVERALCYEEQNQYDAFLSQVSKCSLRIHRYLHKGIDMRINDPISKNYYKIKLPLKRKSNINHIDIKGNLYRVSDTNKLINNTGSISLEKFASMLTDDSAVQGVEVTDVVGILKAGKKSYEDAIKKSKELVAETEKVFNLSVGTHKFSNGKKEKGYLISGKLRKYVIQYDPDKDVNDQKHGVYDYPSGKYICIIDKSNDQVGYDKLINRVYSLHNDSLVASKISTLN